MKLVKIAAILTLGAASLAWGDLPATNPSAPDAAPSTRPAQGFAPRASLLQMRRALRALIGARTMSIRPATPQEWDEMMAFMEINSPARWHVLSSLNLPPSAPVRLDAINKWRNYNFTKEHFPAIADELLQRYHLEDDLFALTLAAQQDGGGEAPVIREKIHDKIDQMVQLEFSERQKRIDKLEAMLEEEKSKLASDQESEEKTVDLRTSAIMNRLERLNRALATTTRPDADEASDQNSTAQNPAGGASGGPAGNRDPVVNVSNGTESVGK